MTLWTLHVAYDPEASVCYTRSCDVPGLITEGETLECLRERATAVPPELLADNAHEIEPECLQGPHELRVLAQPAC